jgi:hypothetical protein
LPPQPVETCSGRQSVAQAEGCHIHRADAGEAASEARNF